MLEWGIRKPDEHEASGRRAATFEIEPRRAMPYRRESIVTNAPSPTLRPLHSVRLPAVVLLCLIGATSSAAAATSMNGGTIDPTVQSQPPIDPIDVSAGESDQNAGEGVTPLFAPIPFKNTQIGWGIAGLLGLIHRFDADTTFKPSTGGVAAFYTENKSWGWMAFEMARIQHDTWRLRGLASHCDLNYDFFGIGQEAGNAGQSIPLEQTMDFAVGSALRRVKPGLYAGVSAMWIKTSVELKKNPGNVPPPNADELNETNLFAPGISGELDTRNDDYWPSHGSLASAKGSFFAPAFGSARDFQRYAVAWNWYKSTRFPRTILATDVNATAAAGDVPFWAIPTLGGGQYGLRGYTQGRYRDKVVTTAQAELRWHTAGRLGAALFGGFGQVAPSVGELKDALVLWGGGGGVRVQLTRRYPMHMRLDYAWGLKERLLYFAVGEAF